MKNYQETLDYLFAQLPMYQRVGDSAMKKNLDNIFALCEALGNPQEKFKSIHIAGTNGKGSVTHILTSVLKQADYKVGVYTSPHYKDFRERIKVVSKDKSVVLIPEQTVVDFVAKNQKLLEKVKPSFFEMTVAMAFEHFAQQKVDIAVIETGLGGRLDSTNIITPILSIITNISKDHTQFLGETLPEIAFEKAGIIKENVPVIIGKKQKETKAVYKQKAFSTFSSLKYANEICSIKNYESELGKKTKFELEYKSKKYSLKTDLVGVYQKENICTALASLLYLKKKDILNLSKKDIFKGIENIREETYFLGRNTVLSKKPLCLADSAHNVAGIKELIKQIEKLKFEQLHFVYGTVSDKDVSTIFTLLPIKAKYYFCKPDIIRGMETKNLLEKAKDYKLEAKAYASVNEAFKAAKKNANPKDIVIVSGSIFVVAEII